MGSARKTLVKMKLVGLFLLNIALVKAHGGLTYPYGWWDTNKIGYENNHGRDWGFTAMGCGQTVNAKDTQNRLNNKCFYNFFNNAVSWKNFPEGAKAIKKRLADGNQIKMPLKMFMSKKIADMYMNTTQDKLESDYMARIAERALICDKQDLTKSRGFAMYTRRCWMPWYQPGLTKIGSPCGVAGGNPRRLNGKPKAYCGEICIDSVKNCKDPGPTLNNCKAGWAWGKGAETYEFPNMPVTTWVKGKTAEVGWNILANHMGGYAWRLCKIPNKKSRKNSYDVSGVTEECFQKGHLKFADNVQRVRSETRYYQNETFTAVPAIQTNIGTWPLGSTWRKNYYFTDIHVKDRPRGQILDLVKVPQNIRAGKYALSLRWDCEGAGQVWSGCATVDIVDAV